MSELPESWKHVDIERISEIVSGGTPSSTISEYYTEDHMKGIAWVTPADLSGYKRKYISHGNRSITEQGYKSCSAKLMPSGSVLFSSRAPIGYVAIAENEISTNQGFKSFVPDDGIESGYLYYYLKSIKHLAESLATGTTFKELSGKVAKTLPFPLAPQAEQTRIVEKLDEVLAQVDTIKARLDGIPAILKRFRQSVLAAAVSGRLTEEWRRKNSSSNVRSLIESCVAVDKKNAIKPFRKDEINNDIPQTWEWVRLARIAEVISGIAKGSKTSSAVISRPYLRVANVQRGYLDLSEVKEISVPLAKAKSLELKRGDILFNEGGDIDKLGRGWIWEEQIPDCIHQNHVFRARVYSVGIEPKYISYYGNSSGKDYFLREGTQSVNLANINKTTLSLLPIPLPPVEEQKEIVRLVDQFFAFADTIEAQVKKAQTRVDNLTQSILAKAFRGELVPQNPSDEPAEKLLERIAQARKEAEALAKAAKKVAKTK